MKIIKYEKYKHMKNKQIYIYNVKLCKNIKLYEIMILYELDFKKGIIKYSRRGLFFNICRRAPLICPQGPFGRKFRFLKFLF